MQSRGLVRQFLLHALQVEGGGWRLGSWEERGQRARRCLAGATSRSPGPWRAVRAPLRQCGPGSRPADAAGVAAWVCSRGSLTHNLCAGTNPSAMLACNAVSSCRAAWSSAAKQGPNQTSQPLACCAPGPSACYHIALPHPAGHGQWPLALALAWSLATPQSCALLVAAQAAAPRRCWCCTAPARPWLPPRAATAACRHS